MDPVRAAGDPCRSSPRNSSENTQKRFASRARTYLRGTRGGTDGVQWQCRAVPIQPKAFEGLPGGPGIQGEAGEIHTVVAGSFCSSTSGRFLVVRVTAGSTRVEAVRAKTLSTAWNRADERGEAGWRIFHCGIA